MVWVCALKCVINCELCLFHVSFERCLDDHSFVLVENDLSLKLFQRVKIQTNLNEIFFLLTIFYNLWNVYRKVSFIVKCSFICQDLFFKWANPCIFFVYLCSLSNINCVQMMSYLKFFSNENRTNHTFDQCFVQSEVFASCVTFLLYFIYSDNLLHMNTILQFINKKY